jgi:hypothetical protein
MRTRIKYVRSAAFALVTLLLVLPVGADGQMRTRRGGVAAPAHPEAFKGIVVTFNGVLKKLTKKEIVIESADSHELVTFRCNKTTKFLDGDSAIKPGAIDMETMVSVDASEDVDLKLMAISLNIAPPKKSAEKPTEELKQK